VSTLISCPFCKIKIVEAYDIEDSYNENTEEYGEIPEDYSNGICPHLAFTSDWAYAGSDIKDKWLSEMIIYSHLLDSHYDEKISKESTEKYKKESLQKVVTYANLSWNEQEDIKNQIAEYIMDSEDYAQELLAKTFHDHETHLETAFVDKGDGIQGRGGPTYMCIFLMKKNL
jgi:isopentenyl diphosphate isomerase/L-lactate dehydrogenase-like FMN-dependent dehydrogenase